MKIAGIILMAFGLVDLVGSYAGFDLWGTIGVPLPEIVWKYSAWIELAAGYGLFTLGSQGNDEAEEATEEA